MRIAVIPTKRNKQVVYPSLPEGIAIHNRSCESMPEVADESVSLIVTSPPYWVDPDDPKMNPAILRSPNLGSVVGKDNTPHSYATLLDLLDQCFAEMWRVLKPGGFACINTASTIVKGVVYPLPSDLLVRLRNAGWEVKEELIWRRWRGWDRRAGSLLKQPYPGYYFPNRVHEHVCVFRKPGLPIYVDKHDDQKWGSAVMDAVGASRPWDSAEKVFYTGELANSIWNILPVQPQRKSESHGNHPCPFPEELAFRLITLYSYRGDTVLDPFCGSGTTAKVAHRLGRKFVGYDVNPDFVSGAMRRVLDGSPVKRERRVARFYEVSEKQETGDKIGDFCYGCGNCHQGGYRGSKCGSEGAGNTCNRHHP